MGTVEEVTIVTTTAHRRDLTAVKADGDVVEVLRLSGASGLPDVTAQVEP